MRLSFAKPYAGINHDLVTQDPRCFQPVHLFFQVVIDIEQHVIVAGIILHDLGIPLRMHHTYRGTRLGRQRGQRGIKGETRHIIDQLRPRIQCLHRHGGFAGVNRDRHFGYGANSGNHRAGASDFFVLWHKSRARSGGFAADVENVSPFRHHSLRRFDPRIHTRMATAVGKTVWRYVQNTHDFGAGHIQACDGGTPEGQPMANLSRNQPYRHNPRRSLASQQFHF